MDRGDLVPDDVILGIIRETLAAPQQARGVILDGVVRTVPQAEGLAEVLKTLGRKLDVVMLFEIPDERARVAAQRAHGVRRMLRRRSRGASRASCMRQCAKSPKGHLCAARTTSPMRCATACACISEQTAPVIAWY